MSWSPSESLNPEFLRALRVTLPRRRAVFVAGLTVAALAAGAWVVWNKSAPPYYNSAYDDNPLVVAERQARQVLAFGSNAFGALTVALFALFFLLGPAMAALSFVQERLRGTAAFQQMTLLSPFRLAAGKFWGAGALAYFVALMLVPCALVSAWLGNVNPNKVARLYLFLLVGGLCWQAVGLYVSAALAGQSERQLRGGLLVGPLVAVGGAVTALAFKEYFTVDYERLWSLPSSAWEYSYYVEQGRYWCHFYGARLPAYVVILAALAFVGVWAFVGAVRRVKVWQLIPVGPRAAWLFFLTAEALLVGLLWGRHADDTEPVERLAAYMLLNWGALACLAGASALTRGRLREWWSAARDPLALLRRTETKNTFATFLAAAGIALAGLFALWMSYHVDLFGNPVEYNFVSQFLPVALCFALTLAATAAFVQFCAMFRFRIGGWAGVALVVAFYTFAGVAGALLDAPDNTAALLNPLTYAETITKGDYFMDSTFRTEVEPVYGGEVTASGPQGVTRDRIYLGNRVVPATDYKAKPAPRYDAAAATLRGLAAEAVLCLAFLGLAYLKWGRTRREMLREGAV
jgi:hypothetical protein